LTTEEWTKGHWDSSHTQGAQWVYSWVQDVGETVLESVGRRLNISLGKCATVFLAEICAILAYAYEIQMNARPEKYLYLF